MTDNRAARTFVTYFRVSTSKQGLLGLGMDGQREPVARITAGGTVLQEFNEVESGKRSENRPQLMAALDLCRRTKAVLVIAKLDRLARNVHFISGLMQSGVEFIAADLPEANPLTLHVMAAFAEHEAKAISERTKTALKAAKARGKVLGNPQWEAALQKARLVKDPNPIPDAVIQMMMEHRRNGLTLREVADKLNALNVTTPKGNRWYACTVNKALGKGLQKAA